MAYLAVQILTGLLCISTFLLFSSFPVLLFAWEALLGESRRRNISIRVKSLSSQLVILEGCFLGKVGVLLDCLSYSLFQGEGQNHLSFTPVRTYALQRILTILHDYYKTEGGYSLEVLGQVVRLLTDIAYFLSVCWGFLVLEINCSSHGSGN